PEMEDWVRGIDARSEEKDLAPDPDFPLVLQAGRHMNMNANTLMRDPSWNEGRRFCTVMVHPDDAAGLKILDGQTVRVVTEAGRVEIEAEVTDATRKGQVVIPHGFGMVHHGGQTSGANVNRLTKNTWRDSFAGTPLHRYVRCRIERL
ncbi:MAG TPA: molybdopterin dinucleotide binding domain-containing protein, partial [Deltaproteobacteria bacterium]|nr:molybdopterin dinucleotide binding domain-containing protein [Deltaproteobacteria bacterium]